MAAPSKRLKMGCEHTDADTDSALSCFLQWCKRVGLELSRKVCVSAEGTVAQYGMLATQHIQEGELLFSVPRSALLNPRTSAIRDLLKKEEAALQSRSGWVPLLIALLHESTSSSSHWQPYLSLWPGFSSLNHPMFWEEGERARLLQGTGVLEAVQRDLRNIEDEHQSIVLPFLRAHPQTFPPNTHCLQLYKRLVAFVMAYSFQEPSDNDEEDDDDEDEDEELNPPMMVPMADILNHISNHNANLEFTPDCLKMVSLRAISAGEEIFNTYGQLANWQLLHMYGFTEPAPGNSQDAVEIPMETLREAALHGSAVDEDRVLEKWEFLKSLKIVGGAFVIDQSGAPTQEPLCTVLRVLTMSQQEFQEYREHEGWEEAEAELTLTHAGLASLAPGWKRLLREAVRLRLRAYSSGLSQDQALPGHALPCERQRHALRLRLGQKHILSHMLHLLAEPSHCSQ